MLKKTLHFKNREVKGTSVSEPQEGIKRDMDEINDTLNLLEISRWTGPMCLALERGR